jgi:competence protein ComEA
MRKNISVANGFFYVSLLIVFSILSSSTLYAQKFDQEYLKWKADQEAQDARLKRGHAASSKNYYLSRPTLSATTESKVSLNQANAEQLQTLAGVGLKKAEAIIAYRQKHGKFKAIEDVQFVKGIGPALFAKNKSRLGL